MRLYKYGILLLLAGCAGLPQTPRVPPVGEATLEAYRLLPPTDTVKISAVGDIMLGGSAAPYLEERGYAYAFAATQSLYQDADIVLGNLETALTERSELLVDKKYRFRNPPDKVAVALQAAGFNIVSLANNHSMDYGVGGLQDTMAVLDKYGIRYHGAGMNLAAARQPVIFTLENGQRLGFLAYSLTYPEEFWANASRPGCAFGHLPHIREDVSKLKSQVDIVTVSFHWGRESTTELRPYQPMLAYAAIDAGADLIVGHHPHILQAAERYKHGLILYSLGNYTFGTFSNRVHSSVVANIYFRRNRFERMELVPITIDNFQVYFQPQVMQEAAANMVFEELQALSLQRNTLLKRDKQIIYLEGEQVALDEEMP